MRKKWFSLIAAGIMATASASGSSAGNSEGADAWIEVQDRSGSLVITPYGRVDRASRVEYLLIVTKQGRSGHTRSTQSGAASLADNEPRALGQVVLGVRENDRYSIDLQVLEDGVVIAEDHLSYPH